MELLLEPEWVMAMAVDWEVELGHWWEVELVVGWAQLWVVVMVGK
jgi:hypothetical protein